MGTFLQLPNICALTEALRDRFGLKTFIETGTYVGGTTQWAARHFHDTITIDISARHQRTALQSLVGLRVTPLVGDSRTLLPQAIEALHGAPAAFWLDAHNERRLFGPGPDDCPLREELHAIFDAPDRHPHHCVLIDDAQCFTSDRYDRKVWPGITEIAAIARQHGPRWVGIADDVILVLPPEAEPDIREFIINRTRVQQA